MNSSLSRLAVLAVIVYASLAGLRTLYDPDVWWQMATGRHLVTTGHIARTEIFSYTAQGAPWIYPVGAGVIFHMLYSLGGVRLLSMLSVVACGLTAWILLRRGGVMRCVVIALAVPAIAAATMVRANMFTTVLAAVFLTTLTGPSPALWLLPLLMIAWVNLHPGFIYGLAIVLVFVFSRPRQLAPVAAATLAATLINPWGWRIYEAILAQNASMPLHRAFIAEWSPAPLSWAVLQDSLHWRDPLSQVYWLFLLAAAGVIAGLLRRQIWGPFILAASAAAALSFYRFTGLFAVAAGAILPDLLSGAGFSLRFLPQVFNPFLLAPLIILFAGWRSEQLISNQFYFSHGSNEVFGVGAAPWIPDRAARFIEEHGLPRELYHDYVLGGYLSWRLAPRYPVFIDGRALPYGDGLFVEREKLSGKSPDGADWRAAIERWKIHTMLISTDRSNGYGALALRSLCDSKDFGLAYLDETAAVFVTPNPPTELPYLSCETAKIPPPPADASTAQRYLYWANLATLYNELTRPAEAEQAITECRRIFEIGRAHV